MKKTLTILLLCIAFFTSKNLSAQRQFVEYKFAGTIGKSPVVLSFIEPDHFYNFIEGNYRFIKYGKSFKFKGEDGVFDGTVKLTTFYNGKKTGYFIFENLDYSKKRIRGKWYNKSGSKSFDVVLKKA